MKFEISQRARRELERINRWWIENRDARDLFVRELAEGEIHLSTAPESEVWRKRGDRYDATRERLLVLAVWGATRGTTPKL